jgi:NAD(P)-dependent dehydrogenase (short-subunit alcohol dehydrogenase family)
MARFPMPDTPTIGLSQTALVTGGARRIGAAIVRTLAQAGFAVAIHTEHSRQEADALCADIVGSGGRAGVILGDLADHDDVLRLVRDAATALGPLTLLVNNAAEFGLDEIGQLDRARFDHHFAVNLRAPLFLSEAFAAQAPEHADPSIVNIVDQRVFRPTPRFVSYTLTKSALHTATATLAQALAPRVRVNAVAPGPTLPSARQDAADFARQAATVPLGRGPSVQDVADAVLYLARARSVTGVTIAVDGGQHLDWRTAGSDGTE